MNRLMCVVGSGPSGITCAYALVKAGHKVMLIDVGFTLENEYRKLVSDYLKDREKDKLIRDIYNLRKKHYKHSDAQPLKTLFGSNYPYKIMKETAIISDNTAVVRSSLAKGGFSTVWGANVSAIIPKEMQAWPIVFDDLKPYYYKLEEIVDIASPKGEMLEIYPIDIGQNPNFPLGKQGKDLYESLKNHKDSLAKDGIYIGRAKMAIGPKYSLDGKGCTPCGLCMHGCPNNAIFSAEFVLDRLKDKDNFTYLPGKLLMSFKEENGRVNLYVKDINTNTTSTISCSRLFLACGVINTTCIVARSLNLTEHEFTIKDSQKYIFPLIRWQRSKGCIDMDENTADQIYVEIDNPDVGPNVVHLQFYGYNDLLLDPIRRKLGPITELIPKFFSVFLERLMICFVYLHSEDSGTLSLNVNDSATNNEGMGRIKGHFNQHSNTIMQSILRLLRKHRKAFGGIPIEHGLQTLLPGDSQHIGCSLPMSKEPNMYQTDLLGRPYGCNFVHIVDSSVLPSVPATPLTLTVMANAYRIADAISKNKG